MIFKSIIVSGLLLGSVYASTLDDAFEADKRQDYVTAVKLYKKSMPLVQENSIRNAPNIRGHKFILEDPVNVGVRAYSFFYF